MEIKDTNPFDFDTETSFEHSGLLCKYYAEALKKYEVKKEGILSNVRILQLTKYKDPELYKEICSKNYLGLNASRLLAEHKNNLTTTDREQRLAHAWVQANNRHPMVNGGKPLLECILEEEPTDRDRLIASTIIQWLGTAGGVDLIESAIGEYFKR